MMQVRDKVFILTQVYASVIYQNPRICWTQWIPVPIREFSIDLVKWVEFSELRKKSTVECYQRHFISKNRDILRFYYHLWVDIYSVWWVAIGNYLEVVMTLHFDR